MSMYTNCQTQYVPSNCVPASLIRCNVFAALASSSLAALIHPRDRYPLIIVNAGMPTTFNTN